MLISHTRIQSKKRIKAYLTDYNMRLNARNRCPTARNFDCCAHTGNWATDIAGGAQYGYSLMTVIFASTLLATFLQYLALKLGIAADIDLAQACRYAETC